MKIFQGGFCRKANLISSVELSANPKVYFPYERLHEPDGLFDTTVGLELFQNMIVTLDFHSMNLILQKGLPASKQRHSK